MHGDNGIHSAVAHAPHHEPEIRLKAESERMAHPDYVPTRAVRARIVLVSGMRCIGGIHVRNPDGRISDVLNDERSFIPLTDVVLEGDSTSYDFLTVSKSQIAMIYEINHD